LRDLHAFFAVVQSGTKAAAQLRVKQPSVSKTIDDLEGVLGPRHFDRSPQGGPANDLRKCVDRMQRRGVSIKAADRKNRVPVRSDQRRGEDWVRAVHGGTLLPSVIC